LVNAGETSREKTIISLALLTGVVFCLNGCASYPDRSVAAIPGCGPSVIIISNKKSGILSETWRATCKGKSYTCIRGAYGQVVCSAD
jgi:hypothetical protein